MTSDQNGNKNPNSIVLRLIVDIDKLIESIVASEIAWNAKGSQSTEPFRTQGLTLSCELTT